MASQVEEHGLARRPEDADRTARRRRRGCATSVVAPDSGTSASTGSGREAVVAGEVDAREDLPQQPARKQAHVDVRRLQPARRRRRRGPGRIVSNTHGHPRPSRSRPKPKNAPACERAGDRPGRTYRPSASACHSSINASGTGAPSPSSTRTRSRIRLPCVSVCAMRPSRRSVAPGRSGRTDRRSATASRRGARDRGSCAARSYTIGSPVVRLSGSSGCAVDRSSHHSTRSLGLRSLAATNDQDTLSLRPPRRRRRRQHGQRHRAEDGDRGLRRHRSSISTTRRSRAG